MQEREEPLRPPSPAPAASSPQAPPPERVELPLHLQQTQVGGPLPDPFGTVRSTPPHGYPALDSGSAAPGGGSAAPGGGSGAPGGSAPGAGGAMGGEGGDPGDSAGPQPALAIAGYSEFLELHRGGQGIVYRALQLSTRRVVAIKVLREGPQADATARKRFVREVQLAAQFEHPNIVSVFDSGTTLRGELYFVMEFVRGMELDRWVRERRLTVEDIVQLYRVILDAVHHAHERGVVHRDLKPSNILIDEAGQPRLVDFGLARGLQSGGDSFASMTGQLLGTMAYMSPEQVRADPAIDARSDVYSLGVILYDLLTGSSPYPPATQVLDILRHITETPARRPSRVWSQAGGVQRRSGSGRHADRCPIDADLETIVLKAIAKEPARRYASARAFADDLARHAAGLPVQAHRESGIYVLRKRVSRNRRSILFAAAALVLAALGWWLAPRPHRASTTALDPAVVAEYAAAEARYAEMRVELQAALDERVAAGDLTIDPVTKESLRIVADAVSQLRTALAGDPSNRDLRRLLLATYDREIALLRRIASLPNAGALP